MSFSNFFYRKKSSITVIPANSRKQPPPPLTRIPTNIHGKQEKIGFPSPPSSPLYGSTLTPFPSFSELHSHFSPFSLSSPISMEKSIQKNEKEQEREREKERKIKRNQFTKLKEKTIKSQSSSSFEISSESDSDTGSDTDNSSFENLNQKYRESTNKIRSLSMDSHLRDKYKIERRRAALENLTRIVESELRTPSNSPHASSSIKAKDFDNEKEKKNQEMGKESPSSLNFSILIDKVDGRGRERRVEDGRIERMDSMSGKIGSELPFSSFSSISGSVVNSSPSISTSTFPSILNTDSSREKFKKEKEKDKQEKNENRNKNQTLTVPKENFSRSRRAKSEPPSKSGFYHYFKSRSRHEHS